MPVEANKKPRVRFAPSPTGLLHVGTVRTALFNYLFAKKHKGKFILRIEDTDLERSDPKYEKDIIDGLAWLGIKWDEFYKQSERIKTYTKYLKKLLDSGQAFYCYHSEKELEQERKQKLKNNQTPIHICDHFNSQPQNKNNQKGILRLRPPKKKIVFNDLIRGRVEFDSNLFGDFSIAKDLKTPLYNFAVVIDDCEMKISHVIRGEDHISNTPKQILLYEALGMPIPKFAHLPLILGPDKTKLSKRHGAVSVIDYRRQGYLSSAMINFMALLGWSAQGLDKRSKQEEEIFSLKELINEFSLDKIQKGGAVFNIEKLNWFNGYYIRRLSIDKLTQLCLPYLIREGMIEPKFRTKQYPPAYGGYSLEQEFMVAKTKKIIKPEKIKKIIAVEQTRIKKLSEVGELTRFFFKQPEYDPKLLKWKNMSAKEVKQILDKLKNILSEMKKEEFTIQKLTEKLMSEADKIGDRGKLLWPLRVALSGEKTSPSPFEIADILGKEESLNRIKYAQNLLK